jgi:hypothetical protein
MNVFGGGWKIIVILCVLFLLTSSGCVTQPAENSSSSVIITEKIREESTPQYIGDHQYWIKIDPIDDFLTESPFNVNGITKFNITGTTNFPAGSLFWVTIVEEERERNLFSEVLVQSIVNSAGVNTISYPVDIQGNPPAHYRVEIRKANQNLTATEQFRIVLIPSNEKWLWIHINPIRWDREGENLNISGTTNLPVDSVINIYSAIFAHPCPTQVPGGNTPAAIVIDKPLIVHRTFCGGECKEFVNETVPVLEGKEGINLWKYSLNTSGWCPNEIYWVSAYRSNWKNVTSDYQELRFG